MSVAPHPPRTDDPDAAMLRDHLARHDADCPNCGYNLRNLASDRCPECGTAVELRVGYRDAHSALWLAALVPATLVAGVGLLWGLLTILNGPPAGRYRFAFAYAMASGAVPLVVMATRERFLRLGRLWRVAVVAAMIGHAALFYAFWCFEIGW